MKLLPYIVVNVSIVVLALVVYEGLRTQDPAPTQIPGFVSSDMGPSVRMRRVVEGRTKCRARPAACRAWTTLEKQTSRSRVCAMCDASLACLGNGAVANAC